MLRKRWIFVLLPLLTVACANEPSKATPLRNPICYDCFWEAQPSGLREQLYAYFENKHYTDPLIRADVRSLLARMRGDAVGVCASANDFISVRESESDPRRALLLDEISAFTEAECKGSSRAYWERAAASAHRAGAAWRAGVYRAMAEGSFEPRFGEATIVTRIEPHRSARTYTLGESAIRVERGARVGAQIERTVRDWLSNQMSYGFGAGPPRHEELLAYHEGARLIDLERAARISVVPLYGALAARRGDRWFAPDETGVFRYEVLPDKVQYPTTRAAGGLAFLVDVHGFSALVEQAARENVGLVVACGDHPEKMKAAFHLATLGVNVYFPCDHFIGDMIGYEAPGVLIGSAPVREEDGGAVIGDRPITFRTAETIVVEDAAPVGVMRYYETPARYFRRLSDLVPLRMVTVSVEAAGESRKIVTKAVELKARAIAVRVETEEDAAPVRQWLAASRKRRAVLFHSAPYAPGAKLFEDFPAQTTFGDPRPHFQ
jgi:hypothetical protein